MPTPLLPVGVVAPHGAGLFNVLWTQPGAPVLEIGYTTGMPFPDEYFEVAVNSGHPYFCVLADGDYSGLLTVDIERFRAMFEEMALLLN